MSDIIRARSALVSARSGRQIDQFARVDMVNALHDKYTSVLSDREGGSARSTMLGLMAEWNPIGFTVDELKKVLGEPNAITTESVTAFDVIFEYRFGSNRNATGWQFGIFRETVYSVQMLPGE